MQMFIRTMFAGFIVFGSCIQPLLARNFDASAICDEVVSNDNDAYAIVSSIFYDKISRLRKEGLLSEKYILASRDTSFLICKNELHSYDTYVVYSDLPVVVFELQTIGFLYVQARALILGQYAANVVPHTGTFDLHRALMHEFAMQSDVLREDLLQFIGAEAELLGVTGDFVRETIADETYKKREQTLFLQALYFLVLHEMCHIWLNHGDELSVVSESDKDELQRNQEYEADACSIDIVNRDERRFNSSPISFLAALLTISNQLTVNKVLSEISVEGATGTHPASQARLKKASDIMRSYMWESQSANANKYQTVVDGVLKYFLSLAEEMGTI